jgi:hypothetical protein
MNTKIVIRVGAVVVAAGAVALLFVAKQRRAQQHPQQHHDPSEHGKGIEWAMAPLSAPFDAPEGATPCETAYIAVMTSQQLAKESGRGALFTFVAEKDVFLLKCNALSKEQQTCIQPRYIVTHRDECQRIRPPQAALDEMFKAVEAADPVPQH